MNIRKRLFKWLGYLLGAFFGFILLLEVFLYVGGSPVSRWVVNGFNERQSGEARVEQLRISLLSGFPSICLRMGQFSYFEHPAAERSESEAPILRIDDLRAGLNPWRLLRGEVCVSELSLDSGYVGLIVYPDSSINLLNALGPLARLPEEREEEAEPADTAGFEFVLDELDFRGLDLHLDDRTAERGVYLQVERMQHALAYRRREIDNDLDLEGVVRRLWAKGDTLLSEYPFSLVADFQVDRERYSAGIDDLNLQAGGIKLEASGTYDHLDSSRADLAGVFTLVNLDLRPFLTLGWLDSTFITDRIEGRIAAEAELRGRLRSAERPVFEARFGIDTLHFADRSALPLVRRLDASGYFATGEMPDLSGAHLQLATLDLLLDNGFVHGQLEVEDFVDPRFDFDLEANADLADLERFFPRDSLIGALQGKLIADIDLEGRYETGKAYGLEMQRADGRVELQQVAFDVSPGNYEVHRLDVDLQQVRSDLTLHNFHLELNDSDITIAGRVQNTLQYYLGAPQDLTGAFTISSRIWEWDDFVDDPFLLAVLDPQLRNTYLEIDFQGDGANRIRGRVLPSGFVRFRRFHAERSHSPDIRRIRGTLGIQPDVLGVKDLTGVVGESDFTLNAGLTSYHAFVDRETAQDFVLNFFVNSNNMRARDFLVVNGRFLAPEQYRDEEMRNFNFTGDYRFNNQELVKRRRVPNSTFRIETLNFNLSLFPAAVFDTDLLLHRRDNELVLERFSARIGESDLTITGLLRRHRPAAGIEAFSLSAFSTNVDIRSSYLNFDELLAINAGALDSEPVEAAGAPKADSSREPAKEQLIEERLNDYNLFSGDFPDAAFTLLIDSLRLRDRRIRGVRGKLIVDPAKRITLEEFAMQVGAGRVAFDGSIDASNDTLVRLTTRAGFDDADLSKMNVPFEYDSVSYVISEHFGGIMDGNMELSIGLTPDLAFDLRDAVGAIDFYLVDGTITNFEPMLLMEDFLGTKDLNFVRVDTLENTLTIEDGELTIPLMDINSTIGHLRMAGIQNVNGEMEYLFQVPLGLVTSAAWNYLTGKERKEDAAPDEIQEGNDNIIYISTRVVGTIEDYKIKLGKGKSFREMVREARQERREQRRQEKEQRKAEKKEG